MKTKLSDWAYSELRWRLRYNKVPGDHTIAECQYCHKGDSRGGGPCSQCIEDELKRRGLSDG